MIASVAITKSAAGGVVHAGVRVADQHEERQADDHDDTAPSTCRRATLLAREPVPERQRPHDRRDQQRLDDHQLAPVQCGPLGRVAREQDERAEQPHRHGDQLAQARVTPLTAAPLAGEAELPRCCSAADSAKKTAANAARNAAIARDHPNDAGPLPGLADGCYRTMRNPWLVGSEMLLAGSVAWPDSR